MGGMISFVWFGMKHAVGKNFVIPLLLAAYIPGRIWQGVFRFLREHAKEYLVRSVPDLNASAWMDEMPAESFNSTEYYEY